MVTRVVVLVLLVLLAGALIWSAVTDQRIDLIEDTPLEELGTDPFVTTSGTAINAVRVGEGDIPLVLLHDVDISGGAIWEEVVAGLDPRFAVLVVDLPGFGLSQRFPEEGTPHTVASMAVEVGELLQAEFSRPAIVAGVGLGGEVGAELAVSEPGLVSGLMMVDVDFSRFDGWLEFIERLPFVGRPATFTFDTVGSMSDSRWAPNCESGGWCPTASQSQARALAGTVVGTTDSVRAFRRTPPASLVPSHLNEIQAPTVYVWSQAGEVPRDSVDDVQEAIPTARVEVFAEAWKAHLDNPRDVADLVATLIP